MNKSPSQAARKAQVVPAFSGNQSLSDIVRANAGHAEARADILIGAVYSAYFNAYKHGNKNQLQGREGSLFEQAKMFSTSKACKEAGFPQPKKAADYYSAHLCALEAIGVPGKASADMLTRTGDDGVTVITVEQLAEESALAYVDMVSTYLSDIAQQAADKRAASKAAQAKAAPPVSDEAAVADAKAAASASAAPALSLSDMVSAVATALRTGVIDDAQSGELCDAMEAYAELLQVRETAALANVAVASVAAEPVAPQ